MADGNVDAEIVEIDAFIDDVGKHLLGTLPAWRPSPRPGELSANWGIEESDGRSRAELRFRCPDVERQSECSISVLFRGRLIHRVDVVPNHIRKPNPAAALKLGLPAKIDGPHAHEWRNNRDIVRRNGQFGTLPCRSQLPPQVTKLSQALAELAKQINLQLPPEAHAFEVPPKATLFG